MKSQPEKNHVYCCCIALLLFLEVDKYSNTLFVSVAKSATIDVLAVDIGGGRQSLYKTIITSDYGTSKEGDGKYLPAIISLECKSFCYHFNCIHALVLKISSQNMLIPCSLPDYFAACVVMLVLS